MEKFKRFKKDILSSIERPDFLTGGDISDFAWTGTNNILQMFYGGISEKVLTKRQLDIIIKHIEDITNEMDTFLTDKQLVLVWVFIGSTIDEWINLSSDEEYYESASNLKKILEGYFND